MKRILFIVLIAVQVGVILFYSYKLLSQKKNILGVSINSIDKNAITMESRGDLKYFFEPKTGVKKNIYPPQTIPTTNTINSDSLNERYDYKVIKPEGTLRIITLGDSFTYGLGVDTKDNWTEKLEDLLNDTCKSASIKKYEVINLGAPGYDIAYALERYKKRGVKYNPDMVLWMLTDPARIREYMTPLMEKCNSKTSNDEGTDCWDNAIETIQNTYGDKGINSYLASKLVQISSLFNKKLIYIDYFHNHDALLKEIETPLVFNSLQVASKWKNGEVNQLYYQDDGHPNAKGHTAIAGEILQYLKTNNLVSCIP